MLKHLKFNLSTFIFNLIFIIMLSFINSSCSMLTKIDKKKQSINKYQLGYHQTKSLNVFYCSDLKGNFINIHYPYLSKKNILEEDLFFNIEHQYTNSKTTLMESALNELKNEVKDQKTQQIISDIFEEKNVSYWCDCYPIVYPNKTRDKYIFNSKLFSILSDQDKSKVFNDLKSNKQNIYSNINECKAYQEKYGEKIQSRFKEVHSNLYISVNQQTIL